MPQRDHLRIDHIKPCQHGGISRSCGDIRAKIVFKTYEDNDTESDSDISDDDFEGELDENEYSVNNDENIIGFHIKFNYNDDDYYYKNIDNFDNFDTKIKELDEKIKDFNNAANLNNIELSLLLKKLIDYQNITEDKKKKKKELIKEYEKLKKDNPYNPIISLIGKLNNTSNLDEFKKYIDTIYKLLKENDLSKKLNSVYNSFYEINDLITKNVSKITHTKKTHTKKNVDNPKSETDKDTKVSVYDGGKGSSNPSNIKLESILNEKGKSWKDILERKKNSGYEEEHPKFLQLYKDKLFESQLKNSTIAEQTVVTEKTSNLSSYISNVKKTQLEEIEKKRLSKSGNNCTAGSRFSTSFGGFVMSKTPPHEPLICFADKSFHKRRYLPINEIPKKRLREHINKLKKVIWISGRRIYGKDDKCLDEAYINQKGGYKNIRTRKKIYRNASRKQQKAIKKYQLSKNYKSRKFKKNRKNKQNSH